MEIYFRNRETFEMKKLSLFSIIPSIIVLLFFITLFFCDVSYKKGLEKGKKSKIMEEDVVLVYQDIQNHSFSKRNFYEFLKKMNIKFPELVFAQAYKESGFKSPLWKNNRNPFGMKEATRRPNTQNGTQNGYAYYDTWKDVVIDYALYQSYVGLSKMKTEKEYLTFLKEMNYYDVNHPNNVTYLNDLKYIRDHIEDYLK